MVYINIWSLVHFSKILHFVKIMEIVFFLPVLFLVTFYNASPWKHFILFQTTPGTLLLMMWGLINGIWLLFTERYDSLYNKLLLWGDFCLWIEYTHTQNILCVGNSLCVPFLLIEWLIIFLMIYIYPYIPNPYDNKAYTR